MAMSGSTSSHSPRHFSDNSSSLNSPQSRRAAARSAVSSPWNQVVRGESEPIIAAAPPSPAVVESLPTSPAAFLPVEDSSSVGDSLENGNGSNGNNGKRPAWNKPSNGAGSEVKPVMGAVSWPALSESARNTVKSSESSKGLTDGSSVTQLQGTGSTPSSSQRQVSDNAHANSTAPTRQKPMKRNESSASSNSGHPQQPAPQATTGSHNHSVRDHTQRSGFVPQPHNVSNHPQQPNSYRHRNVGSHQRGDGSHHHNYGNRREQDRGNQEWNTHRNFSSRDTHIHPRNVSRFIRPPPSPTSGPYMPPAIRHFGTPIGFHELAGAAHPVLYVAAPHPDPLGVVPYVPSMPPHHPMFFPAPDPHLHAKIVNQVDYYFSNGNLIKDTYLRQNMDSQGWVSIKLIAGFNKVMHLTDNIQLILDALQNSSVVEVQGEKIRRRNDWRRWIMPPPVPIPTVTSPQADGNSHDMLAEQVQRIDLQKANNEDAGDVQSVALQNRPSFGDLNGLVQLSGGEGTDQVGIQGLDHSISA